MSQPNSEPSANNLQRFIDAQESTFEQVRSELAAGQKRSHWMWFIFPQIRGLGSSAMARRFAIADLTEAAKYLEHPVLGPRLRDCTSLVDTVQSRSIHDIFGHPDDLKFHSSMTLFAQTAIKHHFPDRIFGDALTKHFGGLSDQATLDRLLP
jgi:uncharacterized protein (DUF1810 family)